VKLRAGNLVPPLIAAAVLAMAAGVAVLRWTAIEKVEALTYDWRVRLAQYSAEAVTTNLGFVYINERSIEALQNGSAGFRYGLYWPRHVYGRVLRELAAQGARAVAFDVLFGELREDHPPAQVITNRWPDGVGFLQALHPAESPTTIQSEGEWLMLVDSDDYFAWQLRRAGTAVLAADRGVLPPPLLATNAAMLGDISAEKDSDGVLRRARVFQVYRQWHPVFLKAAADYGVNLSRASIQPGRILLFLPDGSELPAVELNAEGQFALADFVGEKLPAGAATHARPFTELRVWHMGIVLAARELNLDLSNAEVDFAAGRVTLCGADGLKRVIPVDDEGYLYIDWALTATDERLATQNFADLLRKDRDRELGLTNTFPEIWRDRLVVVGSTATGNDLTDLGATPLEKESFLIGKHWNVANAVIQNRFIRRATHAEEIAVLFLLVAAATCLTMVLRPPWSPVGVMAAGAFYVGVAVWLYLQSRVWLPVVLPVIGGLILPHGGILAYQAFFEQREKRHIKSVFSKIVSPNIVNELLRAKNLSLLGARRAITVFFADVRGFTELTDVSQEKLVEYVRQHGLTGDAAEACFAKQAGETLATVNLYLALVADTVIKHDGTLDKYIGDCVMAFWGAPAPTDRHAVSCVRAAVEAQRAVFDLNQRRAAENESIEAENRRLAAAGQPLLPLRPLLHLGTGINTGIVTVGLMGSDQHIRNYTVFGREVNLASRLETVSGRGRIVISDATYQHLVREDPALARTCVPLPPVTVKGIRAAVHIYEVPWQVSGEQVEDSAPSRPGAAPAATA
jgi:class 3 adenylate cyclase